MNEDLAAASARPDPRVCPLCGQGNGCAVQAARDSGAAQSECWCMSASFIAGVLDQVPDAARGLACVCERCARALPAPS